MSWSSVSLGDLVDNFSVKAKDYDVDTSALDFCGVSNEDGITLSKYAAKDKADDYKIIENGCFAYNPYRINVGSIGLLETDDIGLISPAYVIFKLKPQSIIPKLLLKFLKSDEGLRQIRMYARGTVRQALRFEDLCKIELNLPPYNEQIDLYRRISETEKECLHVAFELKHQLDLVKQLRQAFLREAMQGKLEEQDLREEAASDLLKKNRNIKGQLAEKDTTRKRKTLMPIIDEENSFNIPDNWIWIRLGNLAFIKSGITLGKRYTKEVSKFKYLRVANVQRGHLSLEDIKYIDIPKEDAQDIFLRNNDLLVIEGNGSINEIGRCAIWKGEIENCIHQNHIIRIRMDNSVIANYIYYYLNSPDCTGKMKRLAITTTGLYTLTAGKISNLKIPLPPLSEQKRIVKKLDELMEYCDQLEGSIKNSQRHNELLLQQVLREALEPRVEQKLEQNNVVVFPDKQEIEDKHFLKRKILATYILNQSSEDEKLGDVKFEKLLHLADYVAIKRNLGQRYLQKTAGPYDNAFTYAFFTQVIKAKWFKKIKLGNLNRIVAGDNNKKSVNTYGYFSEEELERVNKIINDFRDFSYEEPEIISTLYAVWNNRIIKGLEISDELLKKDFLAWDKQKIKYKNRLDKALDWMRSHGYVPDGWGNLIQEKTS